MKEIRMTFPKRAEKSSPLFSLLAAAILLAIGLLMLTKHEVVLRFLLIAIMAVIGLGGLSRAAQFLLARERKKAVFTLLFYALLGLLIWIFSRFLGLSMVRVLGLWMMVSGLVRGLICVQCIVERLRGGWWHALFAVLMLSFGCSLLIHPSENIKELMTWIGVYFLLLAAMALVDAIMESRNVEEPGRIRRRTRIALPLFIAVILPRKAIDAFNDYIAKGRIYDKEPPEHAGGLEIMVHVGESGTAALGHVDICYKGLVYTYGAYDDHSNHLLGAIGDGVLIVAPREPYLKKRLSGGEEFLTVYTVDLDEMQIAVIDRQLEELFSRTEPWASDAEKAAQGMLPTGDYNDFASTLYRVGSAKTYKVVRGKFRKYFIFSTNCVALADYLVGPSGLDMRGLDGIITPGTYYALLNDMFQRQNTMVVAKNVYRDVPMPESVPSKT